MMQLFLSYARIDERVCKQIAGVLDIHKVWYDHNLQVGELWWNEILYRIGQCNVFLYLLSPQSVASRYCREEYEFARQQGKVVLPILLDESTPIPQEMLDMTIVDMSKGITAKTVKHLLNAIYVIETGVKYKFSAPIPTSTYILLPAFNEKTLVDDIVSELNVENYENVIFLIDNAMRNNYQSEYIDLNGLLDEANKALDRQRYEHEASHSYGTILELVKNPVTRKVGSEAFETFREKYPDFDPANIRLVSSQLTFPLLEWCKIPAGEVTIEKEERHVTYYVNEFNMSKYPVTNAQYQLFIDAPDGYASPHWWDFSDRACEWRKYNDLTSKSRTPWGDHPRSNVSWYEAMAFCRWMSYKLGVTVNLASGSQWQRSAQGDDNRQYPWGNRFDKTYCNIRDGKLHRTTAVDKYTQGASPYGVMDMSGNLWEWCTNTRIHSDSSNNREIQGEIRGGSFFSPFKKVRVNKYLYLNAYERYDSIGFRITSEISPLQGIR